MSSGKLVHDILDGLLLGIVPRLVRSRRRTYLWDWLFLDLRLSGRRAGGAREGIERGGEFEQPLASRRFRTLLLPLGARLRRRLRSLLCGLVNLWEIILIHFMSRRLLLRLGWDERGRGGDRRRRGLGKRRGRVGEIWGRSSAEVKEVRNGLETIGDGSQRGASKKTRQKHTQTSTDPAEPCLGFQTSWGSEPHSPSACWQIQEG